MIWQTNRVHWHLLPGLDGSSGLFRPFLALLPSHVQTRSVSYPTELTSYSDLVGWTLSRLPNEPCGLIAESFSGPIAIHCAARRPDLVRKIVLIGSFISPPVSRLVTGLPLQAIVSIPPPPLLVRLLLVGASASVELVRDTISVIRTTPSRTLAGRIRSLRSLSPDQFPDLSQPILYLQASSDRLVPRRCATILVQRYPQTVLRFIEGPHFLLQARPLECVRAMEEFICDR